MKLAFAGSVGPLLLVGEDGSPGKLVGGCVDQLPPDLLRDVAAEEDLQIGDRQQGAVEEALAGLCARVFAVALDVGGEVVDLDDLVVGQQSLGESQRIQPAPPRCPARAVVEVEPVDVDNRLHDGNLALVSAGRSICVPPGAFAGRRR